MIDLGERRSRVESRTGKSAVGGSHATDQERGALGMPELQSVMRAMGCDACRSSGYTDRKGVYELIVLEDAMRATITSGVGAPAVRLIARSLGVPALRDDGARLVEEGLTTPEEVMRVCRG